MNLGQNPSPIRAANRKAPAHKLAGDAGFLSLRLERICKNLQLFARYCGETPTGIRAEVKQYLDLAGIELAEALRTLKSPAETVILESRPADQQSFQETNEVAWTIQSTNAEVSTPDNSPDSAAAEQTRGFSDPLLVQASNSLELNFDSLAEQAEIPEANDVEAILARLKISIENTEAGETSESASRNPRPTGARELLLGFEVCKLTPSESDSEPVTSVHSEQTEVGSDVHSSPVAEGMNDESNSWFPAISAELLAEIGRTESQPAEGSDVSPHEAQHSEESAAESPLQTDLKATATDIEAATFSADTPLDENRASSNSAPYSKHEQSENSSPLQSISPDNLKQILELKEELNELLASYKSPQSNCQTS